MNMSRTSLYERFGKRLFDLVAASLASIVFLPLLLLVACAVRVMLGTPVIFRQRRLGQHKRDFVLFKFRTMTDGRDATGAELSDRERLTPLGRLLRQWSLDELPQLWNIVRGDMSFIGPRPMLLRYGPYFTEPEQKRFLVRPGITGLAQINGRNHANWDQRFKDDVTYVERHSFALDLRILIKTIRLVLAFSGVEVDPGSVMLDLDAERSKVASTGSHAKCSGQ